MASDSSWFESFRLELAYFSGRAFWRGVGAGAILRFERVRPPRRDRFQPLKAGEISPKFLDRTIRALKRWRYDIVTMDEACRRAMTIPQRRRFACLTFDGASKDLITHAYPVLSQHRVPYTIYVPTAFPDGVGEAWWLALEEIIAREIRISLTINQEDRHFIVRTAAEKIELFTFLHDWLRALAPGDRSAAIRDLCSRYSVDLKTLSRAASMDWADLARLAADPNATIASATVEYPVLSTMKDADAMREMTMGKRVAETVFHREVRHFAFPFGDPQSFRRAHVVMAEEAGFHSAVSTIPGIVDADSRTNLHALPRIAWDGRCRSLRVMRVLLSGVTFAPVKPTRAGV
ncbi:polysaccharide deacetylase family protein [Bradyrhizobium sp.]|uniref:polysaccharide deacetylase family protein n=1 Tax=Bradyrhizobium sp. TaxID=376 RepID=UPI001DF1C381|nr:polysaccharide deacetylase family protein [Bradyrhizobium sp.]MBV8701444.1 polysaccharide deacetylase family protein [Bradyrhizobium sp.]MBV8917128.1 polysaccharide deacetylase family protein [Bradyrhizobium sp.]MBV9985620.1 polysaccharide deacetylase family protein [Bradyrhizobium sp.]